MSAPLVLSLFPGIGLLDMAFEELGFCVVRGPDLLWGGDVRRFHPPAGKFDGVIGGPPCQAFSRLRFVNPKAGQKHGNLIPEFERVVREARPAWFVMENVTDAPIPEAVGYGIHAQLVRDHWVGGVTGRTRRISFGSRDARRLNLETLALHTPEPELAAYAQGGGRPVPVVLGSNGRRKATAALNDAVRSTDEKLGELLHKQGLAADFLAECPLTESGKRKAIGNGVPLPMGRAVAKAVRAAMYPEWQEEAA